MKLVALKTLLSLTVCCRSSVIVIQSVVVGLCIDEKKEGRRERNDRVLRGYIIILASREFRIFFFMKSRKFSIWSYLDFSFFLRYYYYPSPNPFTFYIITINKIVRTYFFIPYICVRTGIYFYFLLVILLIVAVNLMDNIDLACGD